MSENEKMRRLEESVQREKLQIVKAIEKVYNSRIWKYSRQEGDKQMKAAIQEYKYTRTKLVETGVFDPLMDKAYALAFRGKEYTKVPEIAELLFNSTQ